MRNKLKVILKTDKFAYFIRYFAVFTFIFVSMTVIILQVMLSTVYKSTDDSLAIFADNPLMIVEIAQARSNNRTVDIILDKGSNREKPTNDKNQSTFKPSTKMNVNANFHVIIYGSDGTILNTVDNFSGLSSLALNAEQLHHITEMIVPNPFGEYETYRLVTVALDKETSFQGYPAAYASVLVNTTQLKTSIEMHETTIIIVMVSFWLVSIFASVYLAVLSVRPILESFQKQKEFVENASHELRTPLTVLQNRLESLFRKPEATILEKSESIASSLEEVRNMRLLTSNLLHLARRDDGIHLDMSTISPSFFDDVFANYHMVAEEAGKELLTQNLLSEFIQSDKTLLKQLVTILFDNALKYTGDDGLVSIEVMSKDRFLVIRVADNGMGIPDTDKKNVFDRFYRVDKARTRQKGGFGLGLSLAKQIVDSFKGSISVKDNLPKGTVFEVKLPKNQS